MLNEAQALLAEKVAELDEFGWQAGQRAQVLYDTALACRMRPFADVLAGQTRMVRDLGRSLGKQVRLEIEGEKPRSTATCWKSSKRHSPICSAMPSTTASKP